MRRSAAARTGVRDVEQIIRWVGIGVTVWMALVGTASVVVHLRVFDRRSIMSMHLLAYMAALAAVLDLSVLGIVVGDIWWVQVLGLVVLAGLGIAMTHRLWLQIQAQRQPADRREV